MAENNLEIQVQGSRFRVQRFRVHRLQPINFDGPKRLSKLESDTIDLA
jgi:hypothetical protein